MTEAGSKHLEAVKAPDEWRMVPMDWLAPKVRHNNVPNLGQIIESITNVRGKLIYPLLVVPCTWQKAHLWRQEWELAAPQDFDHPWYMIQIGNQRYAAALQLGYTHVACIIKDTGSECVKHPIGQMRRDDHWIKELDKKWHTLPS